MRIKINGKEEEFGAQSQTVAQVIKDFKVESPDMVSVQLNGKFIKREDFPAQTLKDGDEIDFLYFMGGGRQRGVL